MLRNFIFITIIGLITQIVVSPTVFARPFLTDDAGTVSHGTFELETGCDFAKNALSAGICLTHGITHRMDIGISFGYKPLPEIERGFETAELGMKFSMIPDLLALTASGAFGEHAYGVNSILSKQFGPIAFDINLGVTAIAGTNNADLSFGLCCYYNYEMFSSGIEFSGSDKGMEFWQIGCNCGLCKWLSIDAGINGDYKKDLTLAATSGFTFTFPNILDDKKEE